MYFDIYINGKKKATVGSESLENLNISISGSNEGMYLFSSAVCIENTKSHHLEWLNEQLDENDEVEIKPSSQKSADAPNRKRDLRVGEKSTEENKFCDFCKRTESEAGPIIQAGESPYICKSCAELCIEIFNGIENEL
jgi:hypothetical protein